MGHALSPIGSEFETVEQEAEYAVWLQAKVAANLRKEKSQDALQPHLSLIHSSIA